MGLSSLLAVLLFFVSVPALAQNLTWLSDMDFGTSVQGDPAKTVPPGSSENSQNGSFRVTGSPNQSVSILLPTAPIVLTTTGTGTNTMNLTNFQSFPSGTGTLNNQGRLNIFLGATRSALAQNQAAGSYSGSYSITVIY